jgi:flagellar basal body-associated protein FliL
MLNRKAIGKLRAILIIDILIVASAGGAYLYLNSQGSLNQGPKPADFTLTNLTVDPQVAEAGDAVVVSLNVTNVGESDGNYTVNLLVNNSTKENQTLSLTPSESSIVTFTDTEIVEGNYTVQVGDLSGSFRVNPAPVETSSITLSKVTAGFLVDGRFVPYEGWVEQPVIIKATATNPSSAADRLTVKVNVNGTVVDTSRVDLEAGQSTELQFTYNASYEGIYSVKVNNQVTGFIVVPTGMHNILVVSSPKQGLDFKIDGKPFKTPHTELLPTGVPHTVEFPAADPTGKFGFLQWEPSNPALADDGSKNPSRQITLTERLTVKGSFSGGSSCPSLYLWNGKEYVYVQEVSNHGWLGYTQYVNANGSLEYWRNNPWDYIPLNRDQLKAANGYYLINLTQRWDEIFYLDSAYMVVVDHPADQNVYSTMTEQYIDPSYIGNIYTIMKDPLKPISATNELVTIYGGKVVNSYNKVNALSQVSNMDGVFTSGFNGKYSQDWNNQTWNRLTLNLGNLAGAKQIKLVVRAIVNWGPDDSYTLWMNKFYSSKVPDHTEPTPIPFMEVKDANGNWVRVPDSREIPMPPDTLARTYVIDLTGLFPTNDYSLRINNFWNVTYDYIGVDTSVQQNVSIQKIYPQATLRQDFAVNSLSSGSFTRYGDVTSLLANEDDEFVIGRQGDSVALQFPISNLAPPAEGMVRDYFFFVACWFKVQYANYGFGSGHQGFTVDPLPFHNMTGFPYPLDAESYPYDAAHAAYLGEYNTRVVTSPSEAGSFPIWIPFVITAVVLLVAVNLAAFMRFKKRVANDNTRLPPSPLR